MKIETLLRAMIATLKDANDYDQIDNYYLEMHFPKRIKEKKTRQFEAIRKGIIRKLERLEKMLNLERMVTKLASRSFDQAWDETFLDQHRKDLIYKDNK